MEQLCVKQTAERLLKGRCWSAGECNTHTFLTRFSFFFFPSRSGARINRPSTHNAVSLASGLPTRSFSLFHPFPLLSFLLNLGPSVRIHSSFHSRSDWNPFWYLFFFLFYTASGTTFYQLSQQASQSFVPSKYRFPPALNVWSYPWILILYPNSCHQLF